MQMPSLFRHFSNRLFGWSDLTQKGLGSINGDVSPPTSGSTGKGTPPEPTELGVAIKRVLASKPVIFPSSTDATRTIDFN